VLQPTQHLGFIEKPRDELFALGMVRVQRLERHPPVQRLLARFVHRPHAAFTKKPDDAIHPQR
jgi:hypothetical protein